MLFDSPLGVGERAQSLALLQVLSLGEQLTLAQFEHLVQFCDAEIAQRAAELAMVRRRSFYGNSVFIRGLIEISNYCANDCLYCGIRRSNAHCQRYRLTAADIMSCCEHGYRLGFRTFVLQGGEDGYFTDDRLVPIIGEIKARFGDCALTLSLGERSRESYRRLFAAGADRYLLRHETADRTHYASLHPAAQTWAQRHRCLRNLLDIGYQVGVGFMVGSPGQTMQTIAQDLRFIADFPAAMCGIGPFLPHRDTPFAHQPAGQASFTCYLLSLIRLIRPRLLLPATTALDTAHPEGRRWGLLAGANVVMPNLSPPAVRSKYELYNGKLTSGLEAAEQLENLKRSVAALGLEVIISRGDAVK